MQFRGGMAEFVRQAGRVQRRLEKRKEELKTEQVEVTGGNGQITVVANGGRQLVRVSIDPALLKGDDQSLLHDLIVATCNAALAKVDELVDSELKKITGGVSIPGLTS